MFVANTMRRGKSWSLLAAVFCSISLISPRTNALDVCDTSNSKNSKIYCSGPLLQANAYAFPNKDSKSFVDRPLKFDPAKILTEFNSEFGSVTSKINATQFAQFLDENFDQPGGELTVCTPLDWKPMPDKIKRISDPELKSWAVKIHQIWKELCREIKPEVAKYPQRHSLLYVPHPFIAPGGRFREFYVRSSKLPTHGLIPNGGRVYYLQRSQPPMLTGMVYEYWKVTRNRTFLAEVMPTLENELKWWQTKRLFNVTGPDSKQYAAFQYHTSSDVPRPESYKEDVATAEGFTATQRKKVYKNLASAAESGWDFSSRWLQNPPNDDFPKAMDYSAQRGNQKRMMNALLYNKTEKGYFDYHIDSGRQNINFYASATVPLFTGCYQPLNVYKPEDQFKYMKVTCLVLSYKTCGRLPGSDAPAGFRKSQNADMQNYAFKLAEEWVNSNYRAYYNYPKYPHHMYEKYNVTDRNARPGAGGEYAVQDGFGWTNGVVLDLINTYHDRFFFFPISPNL